MSAVSRCRRVRAASSLLNPARVTGRRASSRQSPDAVACERRPTSSGASPTPGDTESAVDDPHEDAADLVEFLTGESCRRLGQVPDVMV